MGFTEFMQLPWVSFSLMFLVALVLIIQCIMTLTIAKKDAVAQESTKSTVRIISGVTLAVCLFIFMYAFASLLCTYTGLKNKSGCTLFNKTPAVPVAAA